MMVHKNQNAIESTLLLNKSLLLLGLHCYQFFFIYCQIILHYLLPYIYIYIYIHIKTHINTHTNIYIYIYIYTHTQIHTSLSLSLYIYIYIYICGAFNKFPDFFVQALKIDVDSWIFSMFLTYQLMRWLTNFYDFRFKWTATAAIGIHPTKAWLTHRVNFKNAIWKWGQFRRTICNKILF